LTMLGFGSAGRAWLLEMGRSKASKGTGIGTCTALTTNRKGAAGQIVGVGSTDELSRSGNSALIEHTIPI
jgi:hypothetical protein